MDWELFIGPIIVLIIITAFIMWLVYEKKRTEMFKLFSQQRGFRFIGKKPKEMELPVHGLFKQGNSRRAYNIMEGKLRGRNIQIFDYSYQIGRGRNSQHFSHTVTVIGLESEIPDFTIWKPVNWFSKFNSTLPKLDIVVPKKFSAFGDEKAGKLLTNKIFPFLNTQEERLIIEVKENQLLVCSLKRAKVLGDFLETARKVVSLLE